MIGSNYQAIGTYIHPWSFIKQAMENQGLLTVHN